ncbi:predicted protein [Arabidopsis lyrata subsp. lyrata]|uniref:Predicted protein n=1 Tax=Arabidopsis lyrata subsp. lyrata TaxID=81972 RepID=D7MND3_ARALL|nr:predicted protein [Arabidopsis lyrata subsp. lyrata]
MTTVEDLVTYYFLFVTAILYIYLLVDTCSLYFWKEEEEEEDDDDIELGDDDHCCRICHEDIRAFSDIIRLSKCDSIRSMKSMALTVDTADLVCAIIAIGLFVLCLIGILPDLLEERRELILEDVENRRLKKSTNLKNCSCGDGVDRCPVYHEDLKALRKELDKSKCKHIPTILKDHP